MACGSSTGAIVVEDIGGTERISPLMHSPCGAYSEGNWEG